jgi:signal recognition particle subunit SRP54
MVGLQGQGKTTTSAKLARLLPKRARRCCSWRPTSSARRPSSSSTCSGRRWACRCSRARQHARGGVQARPRGGQGAEEGRGDLRHRGPPRDRHRADGRAPAIKSETKPQNILLVVNAAIGQNALATATGLPRHPRAHGRGAHHARRRRPRRRGALDPRGHGRPHRFAGVGRGARQARGLPPRRHGVAHPRDGRHRVGGQRLHRRWSTRRAPRRREAMLEGDFTFDDFVEQIETIQKMGPLQDLFDRMPFFSGMHPAGREGRRPRARQGEGHRRRR